MLTNVFTIRRKVNIHTPRAGIFQPNDSNLFKFDDIEI